MIYLSHFSFPDIEMEYSFLFKIKRTCYDTAYPFQILSRHHLRIGFPDVSLIEPLATSLGITIAELFKGERIENGDANEYENLLSDVVKVSKNEISKKKKISNWIIAITVAVLYLLISIITQKWEITWMVWIVYCFYRIFTEYIYKKY